MKHQPLFLCLALLFPEYITIYNIFFTSRLYISLSSAGPWEQVLEYTLENNFEQENPQPLQRIEMKSSFKAHFIKFELLSWWGYGGGLQYLNIEPYETGEYSSQSYKHADMKLCIILQWTKLDGILASTIVFEILNPNFITITKIFSDQC